MEARSSTRLSSFLAGQMAASQVQLQEMQARVALETPRGKSACPEAIEQLGKVSRVDLRDSQGHHGA